MITFKFGVNLNKRSQDGFFIYNSHRLILMYQKSGKHLHEDYNGIVGIADVPYSILEPTHNKQSFADEKETTKLSRAMMEYLEQYLEDLKCEAKIKDDDMNAFWVEFGYHNPRDKVPDPEDKMGKKRRMGRIKRLVQCDKCLKWRQIPFSRLAADMEPEIPDTWQCSDLSSDTNCEKPEEFNEISTGELRKAPPKPLVETPKQPQNRLEPFRPAPSTKNYHEESIIERPVVNSIMKNVAPVLKNGAQKENTARKKTMPRDIDRSYSVDSCDNYQAMPNDDLSEASETSTKEAAPRPKTVSTAANKAKKRNHPRTVGLSDSSDNDTDPEYRPYKRVMPAQASSKDVQIESDLYEDGRSSPAAKKSKEVSAIY